MRKKISVTWAKGHSMMDRIVIHLGISPLKSL